MDEKIRRLINWSKGIKEPPFEVQLNLTNNCNLSCLFCRPKGQSKIKEDHIPIERWISFVKEARDFGVKHWSILGGEPFLEPDNTSKIINAIKQEGMSGIMSTNGTLLTESIIKDIINIGWDELVFSIDSPNAETHNYLRGYEGVFEKAVRAIKLISEYKKAKNKDKPKLQLYFVITNKNYKQISEYINFADSLGIKKAIFQAMVETCPSSRKLKLNNKELNELQVYVERALKKVEEKKVVTNLANFSDCALVKKANKTHEIIKENSNIGILCYEPWYIMQVSPEGYANPCCNLNSKKVNIKENTIEEVWYSHFFKDFREKIYSRRFDKKCSKCCSGQILKNRRLKEAIETCIKK